MNHPTGHIIETLNALRDDARTRRATFTIHLGRRIDVHPEGFEVFDHDGGRLTRQPISADTAATLLNTL